MSGKVENTNNAKEDAMGQALQDLNLKKRIDFVIENNGNNDNITVEGRITYVPVYIVMFLNKGDASSIEYRKYLGAHPAARLCNC